MKPKVGDIVSVPNGTNKFGTIVDTRKGGQQIGVRYFKPASIRGVPADHIWWIHRSNIKVISAS
tara:strand:- start:240 stop:431 length:192 start_codon:yes stop_codon:yes gene_type:complete